MCIRQLWERGGGIAKMKLEITALALGVISDVPLRTLRPCSMDAIRTYRPEDVSIAHTSRMVTAAAESRTLLPDKAFCMGLMGFDGVVGRDRRYRGEATQQVSSQLYALARWISRGWGCRPSDGVHSFDTTPSTP